MEKKLQLFLSSSLILILLSFLPLYEAFDIYKNKSDANQQYIVSNMTINPKNIDEATAKDVDVSGVSFTHEFVSMDNKPVLVHDLKAYQHAFKNNKIYNRTIEYDNQKIEIEVDLKKRVVNKITIDKKETHPEIKVNENINQLLDNSKMLFEKGRISGNAGLLLIHEKDASYETYLLANHQASQYFNQNKEAIKHNGVWLNRLIEADFKLLKTQKISHYVFILFIFYPLLTMIFGLFLLYICILRIRYLIQHKKFKWLK